MNWLNVPSTSDCTYRLAAWLHKHSKLDNTLSHRAQPQPGGTLIFNFNFEALQDIPCFEAHKCSNKHTPVQW